MKTDVEIAQEAEMQDIRKIAEKLEISEDELELYGKYKAKVTLDAWETVADAVRPLLDHPGLRPEMIARGRRQAADYTWARAAAATEAVYASVLAM